MNKANSPRYSADSGSQHTGISACQEPVAGYSLLSSGDLVKIEKLGAHVLQRPSSWCIWAGATSQHTPPISSSYDPKAQAWSKELAPWLVRFEELGVTIEARLQRNGQIGVFPEHASYLSEIVAWLKARNSRTTPRVLNLFAYTGLASVACLKAGASVTHVDMLKPALDWARHNAQINDCGENGSLRLIPDEALSFLAREVRRAAKYDLIIMDPPSFSRVAKGKEWELDGVLVSLVRNALDILSEHGQLYFTCHHGELAGGIVENLVSEHLERLGKAPHQLESRSLALKEGNRARVIPAGFLTRVQL